MSPKVSLSLPSVRRVKIFAADGRLLTDCLIADPQRSFHSILEDLRFVYESPFVGEIVHEGEAEVLAVNLA